MGDDWQLFLGCLAVTDDLVLLLMCVVDLSIEEEQLFLQFLSLRNQQCQFALVVLAFAAEEHIGLNEFIPFLLQFLLPFYHLVLDLFLVGVGLQLVEFLLRLDQLFLVLFNQLGLLLVEVVV